MRHVFRGTVGCIVVVLAALVSPALVAHTACAQPADLPELRLSDVVTIAVRQSPDLARARLDVAAARAQLLRAQGSEDIHIGAQGKVEIVSASRGDTSGDSETDTLALSASRALPTGGTLSLTATGERTKAAGFIVDSVGMVNTKIVTRYATSLALGLVQPLLRGAGATAFEAPIRQAAQQRDAAQLTAEARARDVVVSLAQAYWQAAFAWRQLEIRKAALDLAQKQLAYTEGAIRAEKVPRSEALAVQAAIAIRRQDVIAGEQEIYERSLALRQLAGLDIGPDAIAVRTEPLPTKIDATAPAVDTAVRAAFTRSAEIAAAAATRRVAEIAAAAADNAARSRLDLDLSAGPIGAGDQPSSALSTTFRDPGYVVTASLTADHAIGRRTERGGQQAARAALLTAQVAERDTQARVAVRATRVVQRARAALASVDLASQAIDLAEQNVAAEQKRFELGKSTNNDVLRRQDELEQARLRQATAVADYLAARVELDGLSGDILARYGIVMP